MMGCGSSMDTGGVIEEPANAHALTRLQQNGGVQKPSNIVQEYVRLDLEISKLESTCPGPRMATAEAWIEHLQVKRDTLLGLEGMEREVQRQIQQQQSDFETNNDDEIISINDNEVPIRPAAAIETITNIVGQKHNYHGYRAARNGVERGGDSRVTNDIVANTPTKDLAKLAYTLGVIDDPHKASTHEDFFANLSESALYLLSIRYYTEVLEHTKVRLKTLVSSYAELNELYVNQDGIIAFISGGTYISRLEESIDGQLETARDVRDKLGSALEQWRICGMLLRAAANTATQMLEQWRRLRQLVNPLDKIQSALGCRSTLHASLTSLECAQLALPHVELKYISNRQILAVKHCNSYLITDIANTARYEHTTKVFTAYESNISKASTWLHETFNKTLRQDFDKAEQTVRGLAKTLRDHREEIFNAAQK